MALISGVGFFEGECITIGYSIFSEVLTCSGSFLPEHILIWNTHILEVTIRPVHILIHSLNIYCFHFPPSLVTQACPCCKGVVEAGSLSRNLIAFATVIGPGRAGGLQRANQSPALKFACHYMEKLL